MSHPVPPLIPAAPDDVDRLFSAYFKKELPSQWPACRATVQAVPSGLVRPGSTARSRLTLAASVAALLGLGLYASSGLNSRPANETDTAGPGLLKDAKADGKNLQKHLNNHEAGHPK
jgi:hypothetical protein